MLAVATVPVIWLLVAQNHSIVHAFFVAPILSWTLICVRLAVHMDLLPKSEISGSPSGDVDLARRQV